MHETAMSDSVKNFVVDTVREHYERTSEPLLLAQLGAKIKKSELRVPSGYSLKEYIVDQLADSLHIIQNPEVPAVIAVATSDNVANVQSKLLGDKRHLTDLPRAMVIAFCRELSEGQKIYLRSERPIRYYIGTEKLDETYREIEPHYRLGPIRIQNVEELSPEFRDKLHDSILSWMADNGFEYSDFILRRSDRRDHSDSVLSPPMNALQRLLDAQRPDVLSQIVIPGDVALILMSRK